MLLSIETTITSGVEGLNVQYYQTVIASRSVVNAETMTYIRMDPATDIDVPEKRRNRCLSVKPCDVGVGSWCHMTRQFDCIAFVHSNVTKWIRNN